MGQDWRTTPVGPTVGQPVVEQRTRQGLPHADLVVTTSGNAEDAHPGLQQRVEAWGRSALVLENRPDAGTYRAAVTDSTWRGVPWSRS